MSHVNATSQVDSTGVDATDTTNHAVRVNVVAGGGGGGGPATIADGADVCEGTTTDAAVQGDNPGTVSAKLRGMNKSIAAGLAVQQGDIELAQVTLTSGGGGWSTYTIAIPGPGTVYVKLFASGSPSGSVAVTEQMTTGGTSRGVNMYQIAQSAGAPVNSRVGYQRSQGPMGVGSGSIQNGLFAVYAIEAHGVSLTFTNNVTAGNVEFSGCYKRHAVETRPVVIQGSGSDNNSLGYGAEVSSLNELVVTRLTGGSQQWTSTPADGTSGSSRSFPIDGALLYAVNGAGTHDRMRGDLTYGLRAYLSHLTRQNLVAQGLLFSGGMNLTAITNSHFTTADLTATTTPIVGIWNPNSNTKTAYVGRVTLSQALTALQATGGGPFVWATSTGNTTGSPAGNASFNRLTLVATGSNVKDVSGVALTNLTNNLVVRFASSLGGGSALNAAFLATQAGMQAQLVGSIEDFEGDIAVPPGGVLALLATTTPVAHSAGSGITWEEV